MKTQVKNNALSVAGFIMGLISLVTSFVVVFVPFWAGLGLCFCILSRGDGRLSGLAKAGIILSVLGILAGFIFAHLFLIYFPALGGSIFHGLFSFADSFRWMGHLGHFTGIFGSMMR